ncbi:hypothetical protein FJZ21_02335 [Candidatus Pacearchaeota archaeon]|nr:hypothetical protein [Candidatus Pacearchaeota archaeon]
MNGKKYVIKSADPEFIGPLTLDCLGANECYVLRIENFSVKERNSKDRSIFGGNGHYRSILLAGDEAKLQKALANHKDSKNKRRSTSLSVTYTSNLSGAQRFDNFTAETMIFSLGKTEDRRPFAFSKLEVD